MSFGLLTIWNYKYFKRFDILGFCTGSGYRALFALNYEKVENRIIFTIGIFWNFNFKWTFTLKKEI
jgi:hypothetical protein